jgi:hypothetical protein
MARLGAILAPLMVEIDKGNNTSLPSYIITFSFVTLGGFKKGILSWITASTLLFVFYCRVLKLMAMPYYMRRLGTFLESYNFKDYLLNGYTLSGVPQALYNNKQCWGSRMFIPDPDFFPSRISDLGSEVQQQQKEEGEIIVVLSFFSHKFHKMKIFNFEEVQEKI